MSQLTVWIVAALASLWLPGPVLAEDDPYPLHHNVLTTMFYVGELPSADNGYIDNLSSSWASNWGRWEAGPPTKVLPVAKGMTNGSEP